MKSIERVVTLVFAGCVLGLAVWAVACALPYRSPQDVGVVDGGVARRFEAHYDAVFPVKTFGTNLWAAIQLELFDEGRSGVVVGRDGWLYTDEEFRAYPDADVQIDAHLRLIQHVYESLQQRDIELVVALLPAKARLYPEHLAREAPAEVHRQLYARVRENLLARGIVAPDLQAAMGWCKHGAAVFLRTDTHWTPDGANCAARALAQTRSDRVAALRETQTFVTQVEPPRPHRGDLMQFLPLSPWFDTLLPLPDPLPVVSTQAQSDELLSDTPAPEVVLVGTSYSADSRWNFDGALRQAYGRDVLNLAQAGKGPFEPMLDFLQLPVTEAHPRQVIWEIPERYLPAGQPLQTQGLVQLAQADTRPLSMTKTRMEESP